LNILKLLMGVFLEAVKIFQDMAIYLLLGFLLAGLLYSFFPKEKVIKYLGRRNIKSVVNAAIFGIPLPLCSCGVIPAADIYGVPPISSGGYSSPDEIGDSKVFRYSLQV